MGDISPRGDPAGPRAPRAHGPGQSGASASRAADLVMGTAVWSVSTQRWSITQTPSAGAAAGEGARASESVRGGGAREEERARQRGSRTVLAARRAAAGSQPSLGFGNHQGAPTPSPASRPPLTPFPRHPWVPALPKPSPLWERWSPEQWQRRRGQQRVEPLHLAAHGIESAGAAAAER